MDTVETLKRLIRLWAVLTDKDPVKVTAELKKEMHVHTFIGNEPVQKRAIKYLRDKLEGDK